MGAPETGLAQVASILRSARSDFAIDQLRLDLADARREIELLEASRREHERLGNALFPVDMANDDRPTHRALAGYLRPAIERARDLEARIARRLFDVECAVNPQMSAPLRYLDAVNRDEDRIAADLGRDGVRYVGD